LKEQEKLERKLAKFDNKAKSPEKDGSASQEVGTIPQKRKVKSAAIVQDSDEEEEEAQSTSEDSDED
jgi:hypothetical protein